MTDYSKLKAAALAATPGPWVAEQNNLFWYENGYTKHLMETEDGSDICHDEEHPANLAFIAAANPAAVLELIAEIDRRGERNVYWIDQANSIARDRNSIRSERDQLKAENEALRKDADRYRWLRDLATSQDLRYPLMGKPNEIDETIDAAMAQEQQP